MATGTLIPVAIQIATDQNNAVLSGAKAYFYEAGTANAINVYADIDLQTLLTQPVTASIYGRFPAIYVPPGITYKIDIQTAAGASIQGYPVDDIPSVPSSAATLDVTGVAGEAFTAGDTAYLSDGSGSKNAGQWYKGDADNTYSSTTPVVAMVPNDIAQGASGTFRLGGEVSGLVGLTIGASYYISGTAGAITVTAPSNARVIGQANATTSIIVSPGPPSSVSVDDAICDGRLTLTTNLPVTTADVTAATTVYFTPYRGNRIALYNGSGWSQVTFAQLSIALGTDTTDKNYDVFAYLSSGAVAIERLVWTNDTTRATALTTQDGVLVKTGDATRRYLGTYRTSSTGQTEDSFAKRFVWNYTHRVPRLLRVTEATDSWTYTTNTYRQANNSASNQIAFVLGVAEVPLVASARHHAAHDSSAGDFATGIGLDSATVPTTPGQTGMFGSSGAGAQIASFTSELKVFPAVGYHYAAWLEKSITVGNTTTFYGDDAIPTALQSGITGEIDG